MWTNERKVKELARMICESYECVEKKLEWCDELKATIVSLHKEQVESFCAEMLPKQEQQTTKE